MTIFRTESANSTTWRSPLELPERLYPVKTSSISGIATRQPRIHSTAYEKNEENRISELNYRLSVQTAVKNKNEARGFLMNKTTDH